MTALWAFFATLPLGYASVRLGRRLGWMDVPGARKSHSTPVPRTGGWALVLGGLGAAAAAGVLPLSYAIPALAYFAIGVADDLGRLGKRSKLALQIAATWLALLMGFTLGGDLGPFWTALWILAVLEIVNFLDGIDLITCAVSAVLFAGAAAGGAGPGGGALYAAMAGAVLAIAFWNATPARLFLGDAGTHVLGFLVASAAMAPRGSGLHALPLTWVAAALLPAAIDIGWGMVSKRRLGMGWTDPHRVHLYQRLTRSGWRHAAVACRYGLLTGAGLLLASRGRLVWFGPLLAVHLIHGWSVARKVVRLEREDQRQQERCEGPQDQHEG